jgi:two-component system, OmpR family, sensor kinase
VTSLGDRLGRVGLRWRVGGWAVGVILVCLGIAFAAVYTGTGRQLRGQIDGEIAGDASDLSRSLALSNVGSSRELAERATRYMRGRPFGSSATLLFVTVSGRGTSSNRPELFRPLKPDNGESAAEQAKENRLSAHLLQAPLGYSTLALPDVGDLRLLKRAITPHRVSAVAGPVIVGVGEPLATVAHAQEGVARAFVLAGLLAVLGALLGGYLIGSRISRPLRRMAAVAARVDAAGDLHPRIHSTGNAAGEVRVLATAFNHMLDRLTAAFAGQREFIADASHELRTPLTVIRGQIEVLSEAPDPSPADIRRVEALLQAELARIDRLIDDLLLLAQLEQAEFLQLQPIALGPFLTDLWGATTSIADRRFALGQVPAARLVADPDRLAQALRNLLTNAIKHTAERDGRVVMRCEPLDAGWVRFVVEDDGPGIPLEQRELVFERFHRTDPARDRASGGAGLGLAIVAAIAKAHGGGVRARQSRLGGARVELDLPGLQLGAPPESSAPEDRGADPLQETPGTPA